MWLEGCHALCDMLVWQDFEEWFQSALQQAEFGMKCIVGY